MSTVTKAELIAAVAEKTGESKALTERFVAALQETIVAEVSAGREVRLTGFAAFKPVVRSARVVRSPRTGEDINVPETTVVKIRPLTNFRDRVAGK